MDLEAQATPPSGRSDQRGERIREETSITAISVYHEREQRRLPRANGGTSRAEVAKSLRGQLLRSLALVGVASATVVFVLLDASAATGAAWLLEDVRLGWLGLASEPSSRPDRRCGHVVRALWAKLCLTRLGPARWLVAWLREPANWVFGGALFVICILALGSGVPWQGVVFAYGLSQLVTSGPSPPEDPASSRQAWPASLSQSGRREYSPLR